MLKHGFMALILIFWITPSFGGQFYIFVERYFDKSKGYDNREYRNISNDEFIVTIQRK